MPAQNSIFVVDEPRQPVSESADHLMEAVADGLRQDTASQAAQCRLIDPSPLKLEPTA